MEIIDARHHLWDLNRFNYSWQEEFPRLHRTFALRDYEETTAQLGVVKSVHVQAGVDEQFGLQETRWICSLAEACGPLAGVVAWAPVEAPDFEPSKNWVTIPNSREFVVYFRRKTIRTFVIAPTLLPGCAN